MLKLTAHLEARIASLIINICNGLKLCNKQDLVCLVCSPLFTVFFSKTGETGDIGHPDCVDLALHEIKTAAVSLILLTFCL